MRLLMLIVAAVMVAGSAAAEEQTAPPSSVQVGVFGYRADGTVSGWAVDTEPNLNAVVYVGGASQYPWGSAPCAVGAGGNQPPDGAIDAWRFTGKILSRSADEVVLQLDWQRTIASGSAVDEPRHSQQLTIHNGDRVLLDSVNPPVSKCWTTIGFEARYGPRPGAAGAAIVSMKNGVVTRKDLNSARPDVPSEAAAGYTHDVDLWLVRSAAGKQEEVLHQLVRTAQNPAQFAFSPLTSTTVRGPVVMQVTGTVAVRTTPSGPQLTFETRRRATFPKPGTGPRDPSHHVQGNSRMVIPLPGPEEVLSFELPPLPDRDGGTYASDQLSVRVRITPK